MKPTLDTQKFETLMYYLIKEAARSDFTEFLEYVGLTREEYNEIKQYLAETYGIKTYL